MATKTYSTNGFDYQGTQTWDGWSWRFRPVEAEIFVGYKETPEGRSPRKADVEALVTDRARAIAYYQGALARMIDVEAPKKRLEQARAAHARYQSPDFDPGGSTNNPNRVRRDNQAAANSVHPR